MGLTACVSTSESPESVVESSEPVESVEPAVELINMPQNIYGAFVGLGAELESQLVDEAVQQLVNTYPPADNLLDFQQKIIVGDSFGQKLLHTVQANGYSIRRSHEPGTTPRCDGKSANRDGALNAIQVCYIIDGVEDFLRLTLYVAGDIWSRLFAQDEDGLRPAGAWTYWSGSDR
jgi:hypothetical protein